MPKVCQYGFSAACTIIQLTEEERAELYAAIRENNRRIVQTVMISPQEAAQRLLSDYAHRGAAPIGADRRQTTGGVSPALKVMLRMTMARERRYAEGIMVVLRPQKLLV